MHVCLDDAEPSVDMIIPELDVQSYIITSVVAFQICIACLWLSVRGSKRADFISGYVTTPFLSTVRLSPKTRRWLRFLAFCSVVSAIICILPWFIFSIGFRMIILFLTIPSLIPAILGLMTWFLLRKATAGKLVATKIFFLGLLWGISIFGELWSINRVIGIKLTDCSTINLHGLKIFCFIGGLGVIFLAFMSLFLLNSIRLALRNTTPECSNLLGSGSRRRWMAPRVNQNWVKNVTPRRLDDVTTPQQFEKQEHKQRMLAHQCTLHSPIERSRKNIFFK